LGCDRSVFSGHVHRDATGRQVLGPTFDYYPRLSDLSNSPPIGEFAETSAETERYM